MDWMYEGMGPSDTQNQLGEVFSSIPPSHVCSVFKNETEQFSMAIPFMASGLRNNELCVYIGDAHTKDDLVKALMASREFSEEELDRRITYRSRDETYLSGGYFDPERMMEFWAGQERISRAQGYSGLRGSGEMSWAAKGAPGTEKLIEYEANVNRAFPGVRARILCQYDESCFDPPTLIDAIRTHPKVAMKGALCTNPYYLPPDQLLKSLRGDAPYEAYEHIVSDLFKRARLSEMQRDELRDLRRANRKLFVLNDVAFNDIQSQLSVVTFYNDLAIESCHDENMRGYLREIAGKCSEMQRHIEFTKAYQLVGTTGSSWHRLREVLERASEPSFARGQSVRIDVGSVQIYADNMLDSALVGVIENIPAGNGKGSSVEVTVRETFEGLVISITAQGRGLPDGSKEKIFERDFVTGHCDGYQLFMAREILMSSGMTIRETGVPGRCSRFEITVPQGKYRLDK